MTITIEKLEKWADGQINFGKNTIEKFKEKLETNPAYAFEWSSAAFNGAARVEVGSAVKAWCSSIRKEDALDIIKKEVMERVMRGARWPERSTSVQSNVMRTDVTSIYAELLKKLNENF